MDVYVDSSVVLRIVLHESDRLRAWGRIEAMWTSDLARVECFRVIDRARLSGKLSDISVATARQRVDELFESIELVAIDRRVLRRAAQPMPTALRSLDAIHVASALSVRTKVPALSLATHDDEMAIAAKALGFRVLGV